MKEDVSVMRDGGGGGGGGADGDEMSGHSAWRGVGTLTRTADADGGLIVAYEHRGDLEDVYELHGGGLHEHYLVTELQAHPQAPGVLA